MTQVYRAPDPVIQALARKWTGTMNYSTCLKLARMLYGPLARVRELNGSPVCIYTQQGDTRTVYGEGATYLEAFKDAFLVPADTTQVLNTSGENMSSSPDPLSGEAPKFSEPNSNGN